MIKKRIKKISQLIKERSWHKISKKVLSTAEGWILILIITAVIFVIGMAVGTRISFKGHLLTPDYAYEQKGLTIDHVEVKTEDGKIFRLYKREDGK